MRLLLLTILISCASNQSVKKSGKLFSYCKTFQVGSPISVYHTRCLPVEQEREATWLTGVEYTTTHSWGEGSND